MEFCTEILSIHSFHVLSGCFNVNDAYHQIDKFDYVDASPVSEEAVIDAANGGCPPYAGIAPPLPPRTGASPTGGGSRGPIVTSAADERIRVSLDFHTILVT